jgi:hypothetical protein
MPTHSLAILAVSLAELKHTPAQEFTSYTLELFHQRALAAAAAAAAAGGKAAAAARDASYGGSAGGGVEAGSSASNSSSSSSSSKAGTASSLASQTASFIWALPKLLLGRPQTHQAATAAADDANHKRQQGQHQRGRHQQRQQQQQDASAGVSKAWMRQYCWLLQDLCDLLLPGLEKLSPTELVDVAAGLAGLGFFPGVCLV